MKEKAIVPMELRIKLLRVCDDAPDPDACEILLYTDKILEWLEDWRFNQLWDTLEDMVDDELDSYYVSNDDEFIAVGKSGKYYAFDLDLK